MMFAFFAAALLSTTIAQASPASAPALSEQEQAVQQMDLPAGWTHMSSGAALTWKSPDGKYTLHVTQSPLADGIPGPHAADLVQKDVQMVVMQTQPNAKPVEIDTITACNGTQPAYVALDPLNLRTPGFYLYIPGAHSMGVFAFEAKSPGVAPVTMWTVDRLCWP